MVTASESRSYDAADIAIFDFNLTDQEMETMTNWSPATSGKYFADPSCADVQLRQDVQQCATDQDVQLRQVLCWLQAGVGGGIGVLLRGH